jgi:hypothetical protein
MGVQAALCKACMYGYVALPVVVRWGATQGVKHQPMCQDAPISMVLACLPRSEHPQVLCEVLSKSPPAPPDPVPPQAQYLPLPLGSTRAACKAQLDPAQHSAVGIVVGTNDE